jgi:hypothetical protein
MEYKKQHGDCDVSHHYKKTLLLLGRWVDTQKILVRSKVLPEESHINMNKVALIYWMRLISNGIFSPVHMGRKLYAVLLQQ